MVENDRRRCDRTDILFRRRALRVNSGIYARRHGPNLLPILTGAGIRMRYSAQVEWLGSEVDWREGDARRIAELATEITRFGRDREPVIADVCTWHADRLHELVAQHAILRRIEPTQRPASSCPDGVTGTSVSRRSRRR